MNAKIKSDLNRSIPGLYAKDRLGDQIERRTEVVQVVVAAGAAGDFAVAGIKTTDQLKSVINFNAGVPSVVTSQFKIKSAGVINNTGGTATTGQLLVEYFNLTS